jgi:hypothetical protein
MQRNYFCKGTLEGDRGSLKVFQILAQAESFSHNPKVRLCSIVRRDGSSRIRLSVQIPEIRIQSDADEEESSICKDRDERRIP